MVGIYLTFNLGCDHSKIKLYTLLKSGWGKLAGAYAGAKIAGGIRLVTDNTNRNTQILIELMNGHMDFIDFEAILTTNFLEVEPLIHARKVVHHRITNQKQKKNNHSIHVKQLYNPRKNIP